MTAAMPEREGLKTKMVKRRDYVARLINAAIKALLFLFIFFMTVKMTILNGLGVGDEK